MVKLFSSNVDDLLDEAEEEDDEGNLSKAISLCKEAIELEPKNDIVWYALGQYLADADRKKESLKAFQKCCELNPNDEDVLFAVSDMYHDLGKHQEESDTLKKLIEKISSY